MWENIINIIKMGAGKVPMDIVFWAGIGVAAFVLIWCIIRAVIRKKVLPICRYKFRFAQVVVVLYFLFALFAVTTYHTDIDFTNFAVYMAYPFAVMFVSYLIIWLFSYCMRCKLKCNEWRGFTEKEEQKTEPETKKIKVEDSKEKALIIEEEKPAPVKAAEQPRIIEQPKVTEQPKYTPVYTAPAPVPAPSERPIYTAPAHEKKEEKKEERGIEEVKITVKDSKGKEQEVVLPDIEPMYGSSSSAVGTLQGGSIDYDAEKKIDRISSLAEEIERRRQKNMQITEGAKTNKFMAGGFPNETSDPNDPKVVVRKITEQVKVEPKTEEAPKTGFTYQRIVERREVENKNTAGDYAAVAAISKTTTVTPASVNSTASAINAARPQTSRPSSASAQDVLDAIARLRSSMSNKK